MGNSTYLSELALKAPDLFAGRKVDQCGAICWRVGTHAGLEVLLLTSRDTGRWVVPKGNIEKREQLHHCAQREALEEGGVVGRIGKKAIGHYTYLKDTQRLPFVVAVYPLLVERETDAFKERGQRHRKWLPVLELPCGSMSQS